MLKLTPVQRGTLRGALITTLGFSVGITLGAIWLHQKHEEELDKLQQDTARDCLDFAASHYERVIRQNRKPTAVTEAAARCPVEKTPNYEHFLEYQRKRDCSEKKELGEEDWVVLQESVNKQLAEYEDLMQKIKKQSCEVDKAFDRVKQKLLADKSTELVYPSHTDQSETLDFDSDEFKREIDAMNNYEKSEE